MSILLDIELYPLSAIMRRRQKESVTMLAVVECTMSIVSTEDRAVTSYQPGSHHDEGPVSAQHRGQDILCLWPARLLSLAQYHQQVRTMKEAAILVFKLFTSNFICRGTILGAKATQALTDISNSVSESHILCHIPSANHNPSGMSPIREKDDAILKHSESSISIKKAFLSRLQVFPAWF